MFVFPGKLSVAVDRTTPGSEGRLVLTLPEEYLRMVGHEYSPVGNFLRDRTIMLLRSAHPPRPDTCKVVTPKRQIWWKNGVREHGIRENYNVNVYAMGDDVDFVPRIVVVELTTPTGEPKPKLPPQQTFLFGTGGNGTKA